MMFEYSKSLSGVPNMSQVIDANGLRYVEFLGRLKPKYFKVYLGMLHPWLYIFLYFYLMYVVRSNIFISMVAMCFGIFIVSFMKHAYGTFLHEAAHYNIASNRNLNDLISNIFITPMVGMFVKDYRVSHWEHHKHLGTVSDTETSYYTPINNSSIIKSLCGIYLLLSVLRYFKNFGNKKNAGRNRLVISLFVMSVSQVLVIYALYEFISPYASAMWFISIFITDPFFANLRQSLEHRKINSDINADFNVKDHGAINRMFGSDYFSKLFGSAGFNRHLLHHCAPFVSYTNFDELEKYLVGTSLSHYILSSKSTYLSTFLELYRHDSK